MGKRFFSSWTPVPATFLLFVFLIVQQAEAQRSTCIAQDNSAILSTMKENVGVTVKLQKRALREIVRHSRGDSARRRAHSYRFVAMKMSVAAQESANAALGALPKISLLQCENGDLCVSESYSDEVVRSVSYINVIDDLAVTALRKLRGLDGGRKVFRRLQRRLREVVAQQSTFIVQLPTVSAACAG